jgi:hypothetical protein
MCCNPGSGKSDLLRTLVPCLAASHPPETLNLVSSALAEYARTGQLTPALTLPSGYHKWDVEEMRRQLCELRQRRQQGG